MATTMPAIPRRVEVVLKVSERCNINCSYCYFFNKGNDEFEQHPAFISESTIDAVGNFLRHGAEELKVDSLIIDFHGGEPLLMKPARFSAMCQRLTDLISPVTKLTLNAQTNATTIDDRWIDVLARHSVGVGISLDGPADYNDVERVDHKGRGTYHLTARGIDRMRKAAHLGLVRSPGALCVINPEYSARRIYRHFVDDLGFRRMDFLLPIESRDTLNAATVPKFGRYLTELFEEWVRDDNPDIHVRILEKTSRILSHGLAGRAQFEREIQGAFHLLVIASNGDIRPDDQLLPLNLDWPANLNVRSCSLAGFLGIEQMRALDRASRALPDDCVDCCWSQVCRGGGRFHGRLINQYSASKGFNNKSILCDALQELYSTVSSYLLRSGIPWERITESLGQVDSLPIERFARDQAPISRKRSIPIATA